MARDVTVDLADGSVTRHGDWAPTPPPPDPAFVPDYPGQPAPGTLLWGAAVGDNTDPTSRHETPTGVPLEVRRTFSPSWADRTNTVTYATADVTAGRLPWVSTKTPTWASMAAGTHNTDIDSYLTALDNIGSPVWLSLHHEPEDDVSGTDYSIANHKAMNQKVRDRMDALGTTNIALALILMGWTWDTRSGRDPDAWWGPGIYDFVGADPYVCISDATACQNHSILDDMSPSQDVWGDMRAWAATNGVDLNVAEWGMRLGVDGATRMQAMYDHCVDSYGDSGGARVSALTYFDSDPAGQPTQQWELEGTMLTKFQDILVASAATK